MIAYKFLDEGAVAPFTRFRWPRGEWVRAPQGAGDERWIHACRVGDLPYWLPYSPGAELWRVELAEPLVDAPHQIASPRGRLLEPVAAWRRGVAEELARDCAARARELAADARGADPEELAAYVATADAGAKGNPAVAMFAVTQLARALGGDAAGHAERARQAAWLAERLGIAEG
jgi:hypothetical protein